MVYKIPVLLITVLSCGLLFIEDQRCRLQSSLLIFVASIFSYFLSYNSIWEYQYTSVLPAVAILFLLWRKNPEHNSLFAVMLLCAVFYYLPSPYFLVSDMPVNNTSMNITRTTRVLPSLAIFLFVAGIVSHKMVRSFRLQPRRGAS